VLHLHQRKPVSQRRPGWPQRNSNGYADRDPYSDFNADDANGNRDRNADSTRCQANTDGETASNNTSTAPIVDIGN
jgi:hypothetical protein